MSGLLRRRSLISGAEALATLAHVASNTSLSATIDATGLVQAGDLMVLSDLATNKVGAPTLVVASEFTTLLNVAQSLQRWHISAKISEGDETSLTGMDGDGGDRKILDIYRPNVPLLGFEASDFAESYSATGNPTSQTINGLGTNPISLLLAFYSTAFQAGNVDPRTFTAAKDGETVLNDGFSDSNYSAWKIYNVGTTPANHSVDMDDEGTSNWVLEGILELT